MENTEQTGHEHQNINVTRIDAHKQTEKGINTHAPNTRHHGEVILVGHCCSHVFPPWFVCMYLSIGDWLICVINHARCLYG